MGWGGEVVLCSGRGDGSKIFFIFSAAVVFFCCCSGPHRNHSSFSFHVCRCVRVHVEIIHLSIDLAGALRKKKKSRVRVLADAFLITFFFFSRSSCCFFFVFFFSFHLA
jgi:hypothetical protein